MYPRIYHFGRLFCVWRCGVIRVAQEILTFKAVSVFDVSQTEGEALPSLAVIKHRSLNPMNWVVFSPIPLQRPLEWK